MNDDQKFGSIQRIPSSELTDLESIERAVRAATFEQAVDSAIRAGQERELQAEAWRPVYELIGSNEAAVSAAKKLADLRDTTLPHHRVNREPRGFATVASLSGSISSYALPQGITVFTPPYDVAAGPDLAGQPTEGRSDVHGGYVMVNVPWNTDTHGYRAASARVGLVIRPSVVGTIDVRPWITYDWDWSVNAYNLSAHTEGHIDTTVFADPGAEQVAHSRVTLWDYTTATDVSSDWDSGVLAWRNPNVNFPGDPARLYTVWFSATVAGDESGKAGIGTLWIGGSSHFDGRLEMWIEQVATQLKL